MFPDHVEELLKKRYYLSGEVFKNYYGTDGIENWEMLCRRVAKTISRFNQEYEDIYFKLMYDRVFLPNSPTLFGAGVNGLCYSACFVIPMEDSIEGWGNSFRLGMKIQTAGGGCGFPLHHLRPFGFPVSGKRAKAAGPIEFMKCWDQISKSFSQAVRNGANMGTLRVDHPNIEDFISCKDKDGEISNFNISVAVTNKFMNAVEKNEQFDLIWKDKVVKTVNAKELWDKICFHAWKTGEPGIMFYDHMQMSNRHPECGEFMCNPCSEYLGYMGTACNLGSINLSSFVGYSGSTAFFDYDKFESVIETSYRFLDDLIDTNQYPDPQIDKLVKQLRPIGLGVMGLADALIKMGIRYGSDCSYDFVENVMRKFNTTCDIMNRQLGIERGNYDYVKGSDFHRRNLTNSCVAPTGCQSPDTLITTAEGIVYLSEIGNVDGEQWQEINLTAIQESEKTKITKFFVNGKHKTKKIFLKSGTILEATLNHKYRISENDSYLWRESKDIKCGDKIVTKIGGYEKTTEYKLSEFNYKKKNNSKPIYAPNYITDEMALFLGLYFGNGSTHAKGIRIHFNELHKEKISLCQKLIKRLFGRNTTTETSRGCTSVYLNSIQLKDWLDENGIIKCSSNEISIPLAIRTGSRSSIFQFIKGLYITDGSVIRNKNSEIQTRYIDTASKKLAMELLVLMRSIGMNARIKTNDNTNVIGRYSNEPSYRVYITKFGGLSENDITGSKVSKRLREDVKFVRSLHPSLFIDYVVKVEDSESETYDIEVPHRNTYLANNCISHNTISMIAGCSSGIEPVFSFEPITRLIAGKKTDIFEQIKHSDPDINVSANELTYYEHVNMTAIVQKYVDMSISKTINLPNSATVEDVKKAYELSWRQGLKGITVYRDGSRQNQTLQTKDSYVGKSETPKTETKKRTYRPLVGETFKDKIGCGAIFTTINYDEEGNVHEVFIRPGKHGGCQSNVEGLARMASIALRSGVDVSEIVDQLKGIRCPSCLVAKQKGVKFLSCPDAVGKAIEHAAKRHGKVIVHTEGKKLEIVDKEKCPECESVIVNEGGCKVCKNCGYSKCG